MKSSLFWRQGISGPQGMGKELFMVTKLNKNQQEPQDVLFVKN